MLTSEQSPDRQERPPPEQALSAPGIICTVSTILDTLENVSEFVARNQRAGVDHMFICLDGDTPDVADYLASVAHVTTLRTDGTYWRGSRPPGLNSRQAINANLVCALLSPSKSVRWLFHLDGDECLDVDRADLLAAPPHVPAVRLRVMESVSQPDSVHPCGLFKRPPTREELALLTVLGVIDRPRLAAYFRGHVAGKPGVRPTLDLQLRIHRVQDREGGYVDELRSPRLNVLHYDCWSPEEFLRKWSTHLAADSGKFIGRRALVRAAVAAANTSRSLDDQQRREVLMAVYRSAVADDVDTLSDLGLLVTPPDERHRYQPRDLPEGDADAIDRLLPRLAAADKSFFRVRVGAPNPRLLFRSMGMGQN